MFRSLRLCLGAILRLFRSRHDLLVENLALRQQLSVFQRRNRRPKLAVLDKLFWVLARRSAWKLALLVVTPETVVRWHRAGFRCTGLAARSEERGVRLEFIQPEEIKKSIDERSDVDHRRLSVPKI